MISYDGTIDGFTVDAGISDIGQTFTATASGWLTKIEVAANAGGAAGVSVTVYAGSGIGGTLLYSKTVDFTSVDTVTSTAVYSWHAITIDSAVPITSGNVYTFVLSPGTNFNLGYKAAVAAGGTGADYGGGAMYSADFAGTNTDYDLVFRVTQSDGAPVIGGAVAGQTVNDSATVNPFAALTVADADSNVTASVALDNSAKGVFTAASLTASGFSTSDGGTTYTHASATPAAMQVAIRALVFDPTDNRVAPGSTETTTFTVTVSDGVMTDAVNSTTTVVATSINDAPALTTGTYTIATTNENTTSGSTLVSTILTDRSWADADTAAVSGIAVTAKTSNGTWQYSTDNSNWTSFGSVSTATALLLSSSTYVRYLPDAANGETATFTFCAWDQTAGAASVNGTPRSGNASSAGGITAYSSNAATASIVVSAVNDAPVLDNSKSPTLVTIVEDTPAPTNGSTANSTLVSSLVDIGGALGNVTDVDTGAVTGIAVTAKSNHGTLYYTTDGGTTWTAAPGTLTAGSALLLAADGNTRIAFVPQANIAGTDTDAITFKAWDRTSGSNGATSVDTTVGSAFSTATDLAPVVITSVNDAPTIDAGAYTLTGTDENTTSSTTQIATIAGALNYADVDIGAIIGIAVTATTANGAWQYSTDGATGWTAFGTVDVTSALLLTSGTYVRFVPDNKNGETPTFAFRAWDRTVDLASINGTPRYADTSTNGGTSQFSTAQASASMTVSSVNDAPVFVGAVTSLTVNENTGATSIKALLHANDPDNAQTLTWTESAAPAHGALTFSSATAATPGTDITPGGTITYTPTANYVGSDTFTIQVSDGTASATRTINVTINIVATELRFTTQPSGSVSGVSLTGQPVVKATDASGNVDTTFTGDVTLSLGSGAGSLSGTLVKGAVAGVATFTDVAYSATSDQQSFTLTTSNTAGLTEATSSAVTADVVASKLRFATQPAPLTMASTVTRTFTTAPVVQAVDAANVLDTGYTTAIVLSLTKSDGSAAPGTVNSVSGTGDTDGSGTTVTLAPTSGAATFSGLSARYTNSAATDSLALHATSGGLTAANSAAIASRVDTPPSVDTLTTGGIFTEGGAAVVVSSSVTVTDADDVTCAWATVGIIQNFTAGQDVLSFTNNGTTMGNITASYDAGTGVMTLTSAGATATRAQWASALSAVTYANTSEAPNTANRQMLFVINDGYLSSDSSYAFAKTNVTVAGTNDAPTLSGGPYALDATDENAMSSATAVSTILAGLTYADPDGSVASGIAITQKSGASSWAYSTDGITWAALGPVSDTSALLLTSTSWVRYLPNGVDGETAILTFRAWDRTSGTASTNVIRGLANTSTNGGTTAFSTGTAQATLAVTAINDAPTLTATPINPSFTENGSAVDLFSAVSISTVEAGQAIAELQFTVTNVFDPATEAVVADGTTIALSNGASGTTATNALSCSVTLSGTTATVTLSKAAGITTTAAQDLIDGLTYANSSDHPGAASRAVTLTSIKDNGGTLNGGTDTSALAVVSNVAVMPVNDAPTLSGGPMALTGTDEDTTSSSTLVSAVIAGLTYADPDDGAASGIAITASTGSGGWQYSTDGAAWAAVGTVSSTSALLLTSTSRIRYAPVGAGGETATITFRGWDQTSGTASTNSTRGLADASVDGGTTAFSTGTAQATMTVTAVDDPPPPTQSQTITFGALADAVVGQAVTLSASANSGLPVTFSILSGPATWSGSTLTCTGIGVVTVRATQSGNSLYDPAPAVERSFSVALPTPDPVPVPVVGGTATLTAPSGMTGASYRWQRNGAEVANATTATLTLANTQPPMAGLYTYTVTTAGGTATTSEAMIVGLSTTENVVGTAASVGADIVHPNGNVYDQVLLEGKAATLTADPAKITRISFVDLSDDIVQVELSGAGSLSLVMDDASTPAPPVNYTQPGVDYVRGHAGIVITGANETTNITVFSVGRITAVNQSLFRADVTYDGVANIAFIAIQSANGKFGGVRTGNVEYFASRGFTGLYAPGVSFVGPVNIGDIQAFDSAQPVLVVGAASDVRIAGGSLFQRNGRPIQGDGLTRVTMAPGQTSQGDTLPAQRNAGLFKQDGVDVTDLIVENP